MPKIDFNTVVLQNDGTTQMRTKADRTKIRPMPDGRLAAEPVLDADGFAVQEPVLLRELLSAIVDNIYTGEENLTAAERLARGKLARKIADGSGGSRKNYSDDELKLLNECLVKAQASPSTVAQVDDLINGPAPAPAIVEAPAGEPATAAAA